MSNITTCSSPTYHQLPTYASRSVSKQVQMITQTYSLAHIARRKLAREASRPDLHLSRLVGHANLLDSLMLELGRAEREQQQQAINATARRAVKTDGARHIQWADCVVVETEEDWNVSDADSDDDSEGEYDTDECTDMEADMVSLQRVPSHRNLAAINTSASTAITTHTISYPSLSSHSHDDDDDDDDEDFDVLQLEYSPSHSHPPELDHDSDSSEDEPMPLSPPADKTHSFFDSSDSPSQFSKKETSEDISSSSSPIIFDKSYYIPQSSSNNLVSTISVY